MHVINALLRKILLGEHDDSRRLLEYIAGSPRLRRLLVRVIRENDAAPLISEYFPEYIETLGHRVSAILRDNEARKMYRDELLVKTIDLLRQHGIDYVVFKTFNSIGSIDVDIDLMIHPWDYWDTIRILLNNGFYAIDDLSKTYATGFMINGNPIVLDLHTQLTILGIPYVSHEYIFRNRKWARIESKEFGVINVKSTGPIREALIRIAHAIIKEAEIKLDDVFTVHEAFSNTSLRERICHDIEAEGLEPTEYYYSRTLLERLGIEYRCRVSEDKSCLTMGWSSSHLPPYRLSRIVTLTSLLHRLMSRGEMYKLGVIPKNLLYRRNAAHIGHLLVEALSPI